MAPGETISTELCPKCRATGNHTSRLKNRPGLFVTYCEGNPRHDFQDTGELQSQIQAANALFGRPQQPDQPKSEKTQAVLEQVPTGCLLIDPETKRLLEQVLGTTLSGPGDLKGALWAQRQENHDMKREFERVKAASGKAAVDPTKLGPNKYVLEVQEEYMEALDVLASAHGRDKQDFLQEQFGFWLTQELMLQSR